MTLYTPRIVGDQLTEGDKRSLREFYSMSAFRDELEGVLSGVGLRCFQDDEWNRFLCCFLSVIEDCPLECKATGLKNVDKVELMREVGDVNGAASPDSPPIVWALYLRDMHVFTIESAAVSQ